MTPDTADPPLLGLPGVRARSTAPDDRLALVAALDKLLRQLLRQIPGGDRRAAAARALFGARATSGSTLTARRSEAAKILGYSPDHFRKRIEPRIVADFQWLLEQDALNYRPRGRKAPTAEASGDTPTISQADIATPAEADHQILLSRIWSDVYGLRAELIERERWQGESETGRRFTEADEGALWYLARLLTQLDRYLDQYGATILHGESEFNAESLIRLAGWTGEVTDAQSRELRYLLKRVGEWDRAAFTSGLHDASR